MKIDEDFCVVATGTSISSSGDRRSLLQLIDDYFEEHFPGSKDQPTKASTAAARKLNTKLLVAKTQLWHYRYADDVDGVVERNVPDQPAVPRSVVQVDSAIARPSPPQTRT